MPSEEQSVEIQGAICPIPLQQDQIIVMGHGSGGKMMHDLIASVFISKFNNQILSMGNDAGSLHLPKNGNIAVSTDAHVVKPLFFPGGDIGKLAICGTVNDVSMLGARPLYLTDSFILEEGLAVSTIERIVQSMQEAASEAGVQVIAGDTKVVEKGNADGMYITTAGIGEIMSYPSEIGGQFAQIGDKVIISGTLGNHGIAVLSARGELGFETNICSDVAPLNSMIEELLKTSKNVHVLRDPTRGGVATSLNEIANQSKVGIILREEQIPVNPSVQSACEMLGFDPLYIANEGKLIVICAPEDEMSVINTLRNHPYGINAKTIGIVDKNPAGRVIMKTLLGSHRIVDQLTGELLPRIC